MTVEQIKAMVDGEQYDFLRTNPHIKDRLVFLTLGGSHAYGTNIETSDVDVRGCAMNSRSDILGMTNFEQFVNTETDTVVYGFNKLVKLLVDCNPNTIELLGCNPEHYLLLSDVGRQMIQNRGLFLSLSERRTPLAAMQRSSSADWRTPLRETSFLRRRGRSTFSEPSSDL